MVFQIGGKYGRKKGCTPWNKNKKTGFISKDPETTRRKMSKAKRKIGKWIGEKNPSYVDGKSPENRKLRRGVEYKLWREANFARDNWTCQKCGQRGGELWPHHIFNFASYLELRFAIDNGITLCRKCHKRFHQIYGNRNNTREQLIEFLKVKKIK